MTFDLEAYRLHFNSIKPKELLGHRSKVQCLAWSKDGDKLASGSSDGSIRIWFMEKIASSIVSTKATSSIVSNKTTSSVVSNKTTSSIVSNKSASSSKIISGNLSIEISNGTRNVNQIQFCPFDSNILASASTDKTVKIWDISWNISDSLQQPRLILNIPTEIENLTLNWHPLRPILTVGTKDDQVLFYDLTGNEAKLIETLKFSSEVNDISWSLSGFELAVALGNGTVEIFKDNCEKMATLRAHTADCFCVRFMGNSLLAIGSSDAQITLWSRGNNEKKLNESNESNELNELSEFNCFKVLNRMEWPIRSISISHDSEFIAVGSEDPFIAIEHIKSGSLVAKISTGKASSESRAGIPINSVTWHPNKHILAFAGSEVDDRTGKATGSIKLFGI